MQVEHLSFGSRRNIVFVGQQIVVQRFTTQAKLTLSFQQYKWRSTIAEDCFPGDQTTDLFSIGTLVKSVFYRVLDFSDIQLNI